MPIFLYSLFSILILYDVYLLIFYRNTWLYCFMLLVIFKYKKWVCDKKKKCYLLYKAMLKMDE